MRFKVYLNVKLIKIILIIFDINLFKINDVIGNNINKKEIK